MDNEKTKTLHSRYNPRLEAERYIDSLNLKESTKFFILIEPGLGYMIAPIRKKVPGAKIIVLHADNSAMPGSSPAFGSNPAEAAPDSEWYPGTGIVVQDFLERQINDSEAADIRIVEWRPALTVYGEAYLTLVQEAAEFIKRADANTRTTKAFGKRWFRNFFINLDIIEQVLCPVQREDSHERSPISVPLLVTGAGPGLEDSIPLIREESRRGGIFILAVSSSVGAMEANGIVPDMVISTDGGAWARFHLYGCFREKLLSDEGKAGYPLAAALTAALPSQCGALPVLPISDGSFWQSLILKELDIPYIALPQRGTVSAAALDLAFTLTKGRVFIAGIDLENRDLRSHARPYSLDFVLEEKAGRFNPVYSQTYTRSSMIKAGGSYGIYASWFEKQLASYQNRLFSLGKNNPLFSSLETSSMGTPGDVRGGETPGFRTITKNFSLVSSQTAFAVIEKALKEKASGSLFLAAELGTLLFPGMETPPADILLSEIYSLSGI